MLKIARQILEEKDAGRRWRTKNAGHMLKDQGCMTPETGLGAHVEDKGCGTNVGGQKTQDAADRMRETGQGKDDRNTETRIQNKGHRARDTARGTQNTGHRAGDSGTQNT